MHVSAAGLSDKTVDADAIVKGKVLSIIEAANVGNAVSDVVSLDVLDYDLPTIAQEQEERNEAPAGLIAGIALTCAAAIGLGGFIKFRRTRHPKTITTQHTDQKSFDRDIGWTDDDLENNMGQKSDEKRSKKRKFRPVNPTMLVFGVAMMVAQLMITTAYEKFQSKNQAKATTPMKANSEMKTVAFMTKNPTIILNGILVQWAATSRSRN